MTTYYIDPLEGNDSNDGLGTSTPKKSVSFISSAGSHTFYIKRGTTAYISGASGEIAPATGTSNTARTYIGAYGVGPRPVIDGSGLIDRSTIWGFSNRNYITVENLDVIGTKFGVSTATSCFKFTGSNIIIRNCIARDILGIGAADFNGISITGDLPTVEYNFVSNIPTDGIWLSPNGTKSVVRYNKVIKTALDGRIAGDSIQITGASSNLEIVGNYCDHTDFAGKQCFIISGGGAGYGGIISHNILLMSTVKAISGDTTSIHIDQPGITISNNMCIGGDYGIQINASPTDVTIYGNIITNANLGGINDVLGSVNLKVINNTIKNINGTAITLAASSSGRSILNNCITNTVTGISCPNTVTSNYNSYYNISGSLYTGGSSAGANDLTTNPLLNSSYLFPSNSPLKNSGIFFRSITDYDKKSYSNPPSIGAYEYAPIRGTR